MTAERWRLVKSVYFQALEKDSSARMAFIDEQCAGDEELRAEVASLLNQEESGGGFLSSSAGSLLGFEPPGEFPSRIGAYRILHEIDRGGMGAVYLGEREHPFRQRVAIKLIRHGLVHETFLRRFEQERQILARLEHPNIARLFDGGTTERGQPYFVMEYVEGRAITHYCDENRLSITARLQLFRKVCAAVSYAHQNLVVHRDLKPANILVSPGDVPKLLDFGLAKIVDPVTDFDQTASAMQIMTPAYASPEQALLGRITVSSDIYSLGVILYEILTGKRPYEVSSTSPLETARILRDVEPPAPSANFADDASVPDTAARRDSTPARLRRRLSGDLDNIVLMALRKDPARRYASVDQFSDDIQRYLEKRPVIAQRDSVGYRVSRFIERNRLATAALTIATAALIAGITVTLWQARRAERRFNDLRGLANSVVFELHDSIEKLPGSTQSRELLVRRALQYLDGLAAEAGDDLDLKLDLARAYRKIGTVQGRPGEANLGNEQAAFQNLEKAVRFYEELVQARPNDKELRRELAIAYNGQSDSLDEQGRNADAVAVTRKAIATVEGALKLDPGDFKLRQDLASAYFSLGVVLAPTQPEEALLAYAKSMETYKADTLREPENPVAQRNYALTHKRIGGVYGRLGRFKEAHQHYDQARLIDERLVARDPDAIPPKLDLSFDYSDLGWIAGKRNDTRLELDYYRKALALREVAAASDPNNSRAARALATSCLRIGMAQQKLGDEAAARVSFQKALEIRQRLTRLPGAAAAAQTDVAEIEDHMGEWEARHKHWSVAREFFQRALGRLQALAERKQLHPTFDGQVERLTQRIADCDRELGRASR